MRCAYHLEIESVGACVKCGKLICRDCQTIYNGKSYCTQCIEGVLSTSGITHKLNPNIMHEQNWFERHLNWTLVLGALAINFAVVFFVFVLAVIGRHFLTSKEIIIVFLILYLVLTAIHTGWYLRKKKRSLFWILMWFVPFGEIFLLCLTNRSEGKYNEQAENEKTEREMQVKADIEQSMKTIKEKFPNKFMY
jgi:hypothetical protein